MEERCRFGAKSEEADIAVASSLDTFSSTALDDEAFPHTILLPRSSRPLGLPEKDTSGWMTWRSLVGPYSRNWFPPQPLGSPW